MNCFHFISTCLKKNSVSFYFSYSMYIQRVHGKVIGVLIETVENLLQGHLFSSLFQHHTVSISLICFLNEGQQVFLRHAGSCMYMRVHLRERNNVHVQSPGKLVGSTQDVSFFFFLQIVTFMAELRTCFYRGNLWDTILYYTQKSNLPNIVEISVRHTFQFL